MITLETRRESRKQFELSKGQRRRMAVLESFQKNGEMTARECADYLGFREMNMVRPRITELMHDGMLRAISEKRDPHTGVNVAVFKAMEEC